MSILDELEECKGHSSELVSVYIAPKDSAANVTA